MYNSIETLVGIISEIQEKISVSERYKLYSVNWTKNIPAQSGIYWVRNGDEVVYVGETGNLKNRVNMDLKYTLNHTLRRNIGTYHFADHPDYYPATSKKKFAPSIEALVTEYCCEHLTVSYVVVHVGRLEVEEHFIQQYDPIYNKKSLRKSN